MDSAWDYYIWYNKKAEGPIYSRIDRMLGNIDWFQGHMDTMLTNMPHNVSCHSMLCPQEKKNNIITISNFKFINFIVIMEGFAGTVAASWREPLKVRPVYILWMKLKILQPIMQRIRNLSSDKNIKVKKDRVDLLTAQQKLITDRMNIHNIEEVKACTMEVIKWNELEEQVLKQRAKIEWLRLGMEIIHISMHLLNPSKINNCIRMIYKEDGGRDSTQ